MSYWIADFTIANNGAASINIPFLPTGARFTVSQKFGVQENSVGHLSIGMYDPTTLRNKAHAIVNDKTRKFSDRCVSHWEIQGGVPTEVLALAVTGVTSTVMSFNSIKGNASYQVTAELFN